MHAESDAWTVLRMTRKELIGVNHGNGLSVEI